MLSTAFDTCGVWFNQWMWWKSGSLFCVGKLIIYQIAIYFSSIYHRWPNKKLDDSALPHEKQWVGKLDSINYCGRDFSKQSWVHSVFVLHSGFGGKCLMAKTKQVFIIQAIIAFIVFLKFIARLILLWLVEAVNSEDVTLWRLPVSTPERNRNDCFKITINKSFYPFGCSWQT
jgi:hypothetical protein